MPTDPPASASPEPDKRRPVKRPPAAAAEAQLPSFIGAFKISRLIGTDLLGITYEATQEIPARTVSVKVIRPDYFSATAQKKFSFLRDALIRLQHPGLAQVVATSVIESDAGRQPYFAAESVAGESLEAYALARSLSNPQRLELVAKIAEAIYAAHVAGVVHRALSPANILVDREGHPRILDVGVAHLTDCDTQALALATELEPILSTVSYLAPEQAAVKNPPIDTRTDIYSLGLIAYHLLTGRLPYDVKQPTLAESLSVIRDKPPTPLSSLNSELRGDAEAIVGKAIEKDKSQRYQSALEMSADIRRFLNNEPVSARPATSGYRAAKFVRRHFTLTAAAALIVIALLAALVAGAIALRNWQSDANRLLAINGDLQRQVQSAQSIAQNAADAQGRAEQEASKAAAAAVEAQKQLAEARNRLAEFAHQAEADPTGPATQSVVEANPAPQTRPADDAPLDAASPTAITPAGGIDAVLAQCQAYIDSGRGSEAWDSLAAARILATDDLSRRRVDLTLTEIYLRFPPPLYLMGDVKGAERHLALYSPGGEFLVGADQADLVIINSFSGLVQRRIPGAGNNIRDVAVSPDHDFIAVTTNEKAHFLSLYSTRTNKVEQSYAEAPTPSSICYSPSGKQLILCQPGKITSFDAHDLTQHVTHNIDSADPRVTFSRDGQTLYAGSAARQILILNTKTLAPVLSINASPEEGQIIPLFAGDDTLFVASDAGLTRRRTSDYSATVQYPGSFGADSLAVSSSGKLLASFSGRAIHVYDAATGAELHRFTDYMPPKSQNDALIFGYNDTILFQSDFYTGVRAWSLAAPKFPTPIGSHTSPVRSIAISPDSTIGLSCSEDQGAILWDLATGMPLQILPVGGAGKCQAAAFGNDSNHVYALRGDGTVYQWALNKQTGAQMSKLPAGTYGAFAISPDGQTLAAAGAAGKPIVFGPLDKLETARPNSPDSGITDAQNLQYSPDSSEILAQTPSGAELIESNGKKANLNRIASSDLLTFSTAPDKLIAGEHGGIVENCTLIKSRLESDSGSGAVLCGGAVTSLCVGAGGTILAVGGADHTITLADPATLTILARFSGFSGPVTQLAVAADGAHLMAACGSDVYVIDLHAGADYLKQRERSESARRDLQKNPGNHGAEQTLGFYYAQRRADSWAGELLTNVLSSTNYDEPIPTARVYWRLHRYGEAEHEFGKIIGQSPVYRTDYNLLCLHAVTQPPILPVRHLGG